MKKFAAILFCLAITACSSTSKTSNAPVSSTNEKSGTTESAVAASANNNALSSAELAARETTAEIQELKKQSVYFDFDKASVKHDYHEMLQKEAEFLKNHKDDTVTLEGNCDDRGSSEYNLSLGSERAKAVEKDMAILGVPESQMKVVSLGEEKPRLSCEKEECWKENRRVDFVHSLN
jgi:peptidoglycan-associated lipoprotein